MNRRQWRGHAKKPNPGGLSRPPLIRRTCVLPRPGCYCADHRKHVRRLNRAFRLTKARVPQPRRDRLPAACRFPAFPIAPQDSRQPLRRSRALYCSVRSAWNRRAKPHLVGSGMRSFRRQLSNLHWSRQQCPSPQEPDSLPLPPSTCLSLRTSPKFPALARRTTRPCILRQARQWPAHSSKSNPHESILDLFRLPDSSLLRQRPSNFAPDARELEPRTSANAHNRAHFR